MAATRGDLQRPCRHGRPANDTAVPCWSAL